ncbi:MAG: thrombospondin type 3 repeat-containing protein [Patescibacteria group bacterium]|jgi:hypothetical protein
MKNHLLIIFALLALMIPVQISAENNLAGRLKGYFLIQAESHGELWYLNPKDGKKYYLNGLTDINNNLSKFSIGIKDKDLEKIPLGLGDFYKDIKDSDADGLSDGLEASLKTDPYNKDSDNDGYNDKEEAVGGYSPLGKEKVSFNPSFLIENSGKIFIQAENHGELWYLNPKDKKRYFFGSSPLALKVIKGLALGIKNTDIDRIPSVGEEDKSSGDSFSSDSRDTIDSAASAIRSGSSSAISYFTSEAQTPVKYTLDKLDKEGRLALGNTLSASALTSSKEAEKIYTSEVYFNGEKTKVNFKVKKVGKKWLLANL